MNIQIYGVKKCFDTQKAERYFKERKIKYQYIDLAKYGLSKGELESVKKAVGLNNLFATLLYYHKQINMVQAQHIKHLYEFEEYLQFISGMSYKSHGSHE